MVKNVLVIILCVVVVAQGRCQEPVRFSRLLRTFLSERAAGKPPRAGQQDADYEFALKAHRDETLRIFKKAYADRCENLASRLLLRDVAKNCKLVDRAQAIEFLAVEFEKVGN